MLRFLCDVGTRDAAAAVLGQDFTIDSVRLGLEELMGSLWGVYGEFM